MSVYNNLGKTNMHLLGVSTVIAIILVILIKETVMNTSTHLNLAALISPTRCKNMPWLHHLSSCARPILVAYAESGQAIVSLMAIVSSEDVGANLVVK